MKLIEPVAQTGCDSVENWLTGRPYTKCREFYTLMRFIRKKSSPFHSPKNSEWLSLGLLGTGILLDLLGNQLWEIHQEFIEFFRCIVPNHRNKVEISVRLFYMQIGFVIYNATYKGSYAWLFLRYVSILSNILYHSIHQI